MYSLKIRKYSNVLIAVLLFLLSVLGFAILYRHRLYRKPPVDAGKFMKIGKQVKLFPSDSSINGDNLNLIASKLREIHMESSRGVLSAYHIQFSSIDPYSIILSKNMHIDFHKNNLIVAEKNKVRFVFTRARYIRFQGWRININAPKGVNMMKILNYMDFSKPEELNIRDSGNERCLALNNNCIYIMPGTPLGGIRVVNKIVTGYFWGINHLHISNYSRLKPATDLVATYLNFVKAGGMKYIRLSTVRAGATCSGEAADPGPLQDLSIYSLASISIKKYEMILLFVPSSVRQTSVDGYLLPFYKVYLEGNTNSGNDKYLVQMSVLVPAFEYKK